MWEQARSLDLALAGHCMIKVKECDYLQFYSSLSNNCVDGINVQAGKFSKISNCEDWDKCAGLKISYSC